MRVHWLGGALLAAVSAGPLVTLMVGTYLAFDTFSVGEALVLLLVALTYGMVIGFVVALLPALAGTAAMAALGCRTQWSRRPPVWSAAGMVVGTLVGLVLVRSLDQSGTAVSLPVLTPFALAGAVCGLVGRWGTRWIDPLPLRRDDGDRSSA